MSDLEIALLAFALAGYALAFIVWRCGCGYHGRVKASTLEAAGEIADAEREVEEYVREREASIRKGARRAPVVRKFTTAGDFTKPADAKPVLVEVKGAGPGPGTTSGGGSHG